MPGHEVPSVSVSGVSVSALDVRVIAEYDGSGDVVEWWTRAELLCAHRGADFIAVLPLRLTGGAFAVWAQLSTADRVSLSAVKCALFAAFALDSFAAYDAFIGRRLQPGESADVYLADLRRLAELFGGVPDRALSCAFVNGLPDAARQVLRASSRAEALDLPSVVARARAVLSDDRVAAMAAATAAPPRGGGGNSIGMRDAGAAAATAAPPRGGGGSCIGMQDAEATAAAARVPRRPRPRRCWTCGQPGHLAANCPQGNGSGSGASAPAPFPAH